MSNTHHKKAFIALAIAFAGGCVFLFGIFYTEAKNTAITKLQEEQRIHGEQAARGIEDFFTTWTRNLSALAKMDDVMDNNAVGQRYLNLFYEANQEQVMAITCLDESGVIIHNFPASSSVGTDLSEQQHVRELLRDHKPVISDVFKAVEGVDAVALHVPIFKGAEFKGSVGILINFKSIADRYLDVIKIGETGYAWVVSRNGMILYTPIAEFIGKSVYEIIKDSPSLRVMVSDMLKGNEGVAIYTFDRIGSRNVGQTRKYAVYVPVHTGNTFWSIAVASAEDDVLAGLISFRKKLALVVGALFIAGMVFSTLGAKAWLVIREEEQRKQTEQELRESEDRFRQVAEIAGEFIWEVDAKGLYTYASPSMERILGYTSEELVGTKHFYDLFDPSVREGLKAAAFQVFADRQSFRDFPNPNIGKSGKVVHLETSGAPMLDPDGKLVGYRGADTDVTGRKQSEQEIEQQRNELAHLSRVNLLGELAGSLAHELNQPLTSILSNAQAGQRFLAHDPTNLKDIRDILADIVSEDKRAGEVIRRLRLLLKKGEVQRQPLQVNEVVQGILKLMRSDLVNHGVTAQSELAPDLPVVYGDSVQLQQVLLNLAMNACDALAGVARDQRRLIIRTGLAGNDSVRISVSDCGAGIAPEKLERVFDPFYTTKPHGMGLGLSVCRTIITAHGGLLWAANNPERGATFHFTLPVRDGIVGSLGSANSN
jgi:PAS domain S-box-containing protein